MAIGDWVLYTWQNDVDVINASNMQRFENKIDELDKYLIPRFVYKPEDERIYNTTSLKYDSALSFTLESNKVFELDVHLYVDTNDTAGFVMGWSTTGGIALKGNRFLDSPTLFSAVDNASSKMHRGVSTNLAEYIHQMHESHIHEKIMLETKTSGTTGTIKLYWTQAVANAVYTYVKRGSYIIIREIREFD